MAINPYYVSIGRLFEQRYIFRVPKYQRSYAWEEPQVIDFLNDLLKCFEERKNGSPFHHFFGGLVCILEKIPGSGRQQLELIDGQQRISTFILLIANIINIYKQLAEQSRAINDQALIDLITNRILRLNEKYLIYNDEINRRPVTIDRLSMSKVDNIYFKDLIEGRNPTVTRESHSRIKCSFDKIRQVLNAKICEQFNISDKTDILKVFEEVIDQDCTVIHIITEEQSEAFHLFQVLNDRGTKLTDGDLLRARSLEILDDNMYQAQQDFLENSWDHILKDESKKTEDFLRSYYASNTGSRPISYNLFDNFMDKFFPQHKTNNINIQEAEKIKSVIDSMKHEYDKYSDIISGEWPYLLSQPITQWDIDRLHLLVVDLEHTQCIPLLMAACQLNQREFSEIVQMIELFIFRYKHICNIHVGSLGVTYLQEAVAIRNDPTNYDINSLKLKLRDLQTANADDNKFKLLLNDLKYKKRTGNKIIRYLLITIEHYLRWYRGGANGNPTCLDKSRIYAFTSTTIEHIYPQNANGALINPQLEDVKNNIGNLTFLGPGDNNDVGNTDFNTKKVTFAASSVQMNREIANNPTWDLNVVQLRQNEIIDIANMIFRI